MAELLEVMMSLNSKNSVGQISKGVECAGRCQKELMEVCANLLAFMAKGWGQGEASSSFARLTAARPVMAYSKEFPTGAFGPLPSYA